MAERFDRSDFLEALFGTQIKESRCFILVKTVEDFGVGSKSSNRFYPDIVGLSTAEFPANRHVFFGVCPRQRMDLGKEHIRYITALWAALDIGPAGYSGLNSNFAEVREATEAVEAFPLEPSIMVQSGRGFHLYWLLDSAKRIADVEIVESLLQKLNDSFRCHSAVGLDSVLRLPDTWNPKGYRTPAKCLVEKLDPELRYSPGDFQDLNRVVVSVSGIKRPAPTSPAAEESAAATKLAGDSGESSLQNPEPAGSRDLRMRAVPVASEPGFLPGLSETDKSQPAVGESMAGLMTDQVLDRLADKVADRLTQRFLNDFPKETIDEIVERVVEKLVERIYFPKTDQ